VDNVLKESHDSHHALTSMIQNIKHNMTNDSTRLEWLLACMGWGGGVTVHCGLLAEPWIVEVANQVSVSDV
jgi:hypothetical protein